MNAASDVAFPGRPLARLVPNPKLRFLDQCLEVLRFHNRVSNKRAAGAYPGLWRRARRGAPCLYFPATRSNTATCSV